MFQNEIHLKNFSVLNGFILCAIQIFAGHRLANKEFFAVFFFIVFTLTEFALIVALARQPKSEKSLYFEVSCSLWLNIVQMFF